MSELRQRMLEDLQLRGMPQRTQQMYVRAVRQIAGHYKRSPDKITEEELRQYFLYIKNVKKYARAASTIALCGIKFFYEQTLKVKWSTLTFVRAAREKKLPVILSREEVQRILKSIQLMRYRVCLQTIYYGIWSPNNRDLLNKAKELLGAKAAKKEKKSQAKDEVNTFRCPKCGSVMVMIEELGPKRRGPPWL